MPFVPSSFLLLVARKLLVVMPLLLVGMPFVPGSVLLLVAGMLLLVVAPFVTSSDALCSY